MRKKRILPLLLICCLAVVSCRHDPPLPPAPSQPELTVVNELPAFEVGAGDAELRFTTNRDWNITVEPSKTGGPADWCSVSPREGRAGTNGDEITVTVTATGNSNPAARGAFVVLRTKPLASAERPVVKRIEIKQLRGNLFLVGNNRIEVSSDRQILVVELRESIGDGITIREGKEWITKLVPNDKPEHPLFRITVNLSNEPRTGVIVFKDWYSENFDELTIVQAGCADSDPERAALEGIFSSLGGANWKKSDNWCSDKPLSEWYGVEIDEEGHVIALRLSNNNLNGTPPAKLGTLTRLRHLDMSWNQLAGELDKDYHVGDLAELESINLSHNNIGGGMSMHWNALQKLESLDISSNTIRGWISHPAGNIIELVANDNYLNGFTPALYDHPDYDRLVLQIIQQRFSTKLGGGIRIDDLKKTIQLPDFSFTDLKDGSSRSIRDLYSSKTMLFSWDPTQPESIKFVESFVLKYHALYREQGFEAIAFLPEGDEFKDAARQYLATHDIKWIVAENYSDEQGRRILPEYPYPSYIMVDSNGKVFLNIFKDAWTITPMTKVYTYTDLSGIELMDHMETSFFLKRIGLSEYQSVDFSMDGKPLTLQNATRGKGVDLVFLGDAYQDVDMKAGYYEALIRDAMEAFFSIEPVKSYREYFNVYTAYAVSKFSYINDKQFRTALGSRVRYREFDGSPGGALHYLLKIPMLHHIETTSTTVIVNNPGIGVGRAYGFEGKDTYAYSQYIPGRYGTLLHESVGHGFGHLADEYPTTILGGHPGGPLQDYHRKGIFLNVDITDDPKKVKWAHLIGHPQYPYVGIHKGGYYTGEGVWRSEETSILGMSSSLLYFNAWSRELIVRRIMKLAGEEYSFEKFLEKDSDEGRPGKDDTTRSVVIDNTSTGIHYPPIIIQHDENLMK